jgi:hypothetical protein
MTYVANIIEEQLHDLDARDDRRFGRAAPGRPLNSPRLASTSATRAAIVPLQMVPIRSAAGALVVDAV